MKIGSLQRYKNYRRKNSIAIKLAGFIVLASSVVTLFAIVLLLWKQYYNDLDHLEDILGQIKISALPSIARSLWYYDVDQIQFQVDSLLDVKDLVGAEVLWTDKEGNIRRIVASGGDDPSSFGSELLSRKYPLVYMPPSGDEHVLGDLNITVDLSGIYRDVFKQAGFIVIFQFSKTLIIAVIILWLIRRLISNHMNTITSFAEKLNFDNLRSENLVLKREPKSADESDELDDIVNAINKMQVKLSMEAHSKMEMERELSKERQEKFEQQKQAEVANEASHAKSLFLASMSHEIRTPMNGVVGMLDLLGQSKLSNEQKSYFNIAKSSTQNLLTIINDVLDFSKIEAGKLYLEYRSADIVADITDVALSFSGVIKREVELIVDIQLPDHLYVEIDRIRLKQILSNLISNGLKFTKYGQVVLRVKEQAYRPINTDHDVVLLFEVFDSGCGIEKDHQESIFHCFEQADQSIQRSYGGTGLGLAICKSLLNMMGGDIRVESEPQHGAKFYFELPIKFASPEKVSDLTLEVLKGTKVLIFDHNTFATAAIKNILHRWDVKVDTIAGEHALDWHPMNHQIEYDVLMYDVDSKIAYEDFVNYCRTQIPCKNISIVLVSRAGVTVNSDDNCFIVFKPLVPESLKIGLVSAISKNRDLQVHVEGAGDPVEVTRGLRVLVAEDNKINCMVIKKMLNKLGIDPLICDDGGQALTQYKSLYNDIDIVLMDCEMPNMDGIEATRRIRQFEYEEKIKPIYIVALTAHALQENRNEAMKAGMDDYLSKPVTLRNLRELMIYISGKKNNNGHSAPRFVPTITRF